MDVSGLNKKCKAHIALSPYWNGLTHIGQQVKRHFVPIYFVWWTSPKNDFEKFGDTAFVELFLPDKKLLQLGVRDPNYILRKSVVFTNLASLFPGSAPITIITNFPTNRVVIARPRY
jgi:hypothetical protein